MIMRKVALGVWETKDGRVRIKRVKSQQTGRKDDICFQLTIDGKVDPMCWDTRQEANKHATKIMAGRTRLPKTSASVRS